MLCVGNHNSINRRMSAAFTLIEVLVVLGIISLIVGAIASASFTATERAQKRNTEALLGRLAQGLALYKQDFSMYVPSSGRSQTSPLWQALNGEYVRIEFRYKYAEDGDTYTDMRTGQLVQRYLYQDAWRKPLSYQCDPPYKHYTLTSRGPDMIPGTSDDIEKAE